MAEWVSVKDRLPEESGNVIVCLMLPYLNNKRFATECHYSAYHRKFGCFDTLGEEGLPPCGVVTHWMRMPELPEVKVDA